MLLTSSADNSTVQVPPPKRKMKTENKEKDKRFKLDEADPESGKLRNRVTYNLSRITEEHRSSRKKN